MDGRRAAGGEGDGRGSHGPDQALAFSTFLAIPSVLLVVIGLFTLAASDATIDRLITDLHGVMPEQARQLLSNSLHRLDHTPTTSVTVTVIGFVVALWSTTSAMSSYMTADRKSTRLNS